MTSFIRIKTIIDKDYSDIVISIAKIAFSQNEKSKLRNYKLKSNTQVTISVHNFKKD